MAPMMLNPSIMLIAGLIIVGFAAVGMVFGTLITRTAPVGYQDEKGFHFGVEASETETAAFDVRHAKAA
jgi:hypothetical protein